MAFDVRTLADRVQNSYVWYREHKDEVTDVQKRVEFLERCLEDQYAMWAHVLEYFNQFSGIPEDQRQRLLYTPRALSFRGDLRRLG